MPVQLSPSMPLSPSLPSLTIILLSPEPKDIGYFINKQKLDDSAKYNIIKNSW
jgi:hypothetical protein